MYNSQFETTVFHYGGGLVSNLQTSKWGDLEVWRYETRGGPGQINGNISEHIFIGTRINHFSGSSSHWILDSRPNREQNQMVLQQRLTTQPGLDHRRRPYHLFNPLAAPLVLMCSQSETSAHLDTTSRSRIDFHGGLQSLWYTPDIQTCNTNKIIEHNYSRCWMKQNSFVFCVE